MDRSHRGGVATRARRCGGGNRGWTHRRACTASRWDRRETRKARIRPRDAADADTGAPYIARSRSRECSGGGPLLALDLRAMHDPAAPRVESVAPMHGAAVVPEHEITHAPLVLPGE